MVKYNEKIQQDDLPFVTNLTQPMNPWSAYKSFDFQQYYDKKKGLFDSFLYLIVYIYKAIIFDQ